MKLTLIAMAILSLFSFGLAAEDGFSAEAWIKEFSSDAMKHGKEFRLDKLKSAPDAQVSCLLPLLLDHFENNKLGEYEVLSLLDAFVDRNFKLKKEDLDRLDKISEPFDADSDLIHSSRSSLFARQQVLNAPSE